MSGHDHVGPDGHGHVHSDHTHSDHSHPTKRSRLRHALGTLTGSHSHDHAESIDDALEASRKGIRALVVSFGALIVTALLQTVVVVLTGSVALLADTIHNFSDALTAVPLFVAFRVGRRRPNRRYTYGYRRAEDLAGLFILLMIFVSAVVAAWESIDRLIHPRAIEHLSAVFAAGVIGFLGNELVAMYRVRVGREIGSAALVADGMHARVDGLTSLAVALGAVGVGLGFERADPLIGILVSVAILGVLKSAASDIYLRLMDAVDPALVARIEQVAASVAGVRRVGTCQVRWLGHRLRVDLAIGVNGSMSVVAGHMVAEAVQGALLGGLGRLDSVHVHVDAAPLLDEDGEATDTAVLATELLEMRDSKDHPPSVRPEPTGDLEDTAAR